MREDDFANFAEFVGSLFASGLISQESARILLLEEASDVPLPAQAARRFAVAGEAP
ncbi:MAG: hypothetical protein IT463_01505 [Planctomycetes bacterium]|nr:hypothetical protein [Planctomycetota bacterium]